MQYQNFTPFPALMWENTDHHGADCISGLVRVKFRLQHDALNNTFVLNIDPDQDELYIEDLYYEDGVEIRHPRDTIPFKPFTDLIVNASTYPPVLNMAAWKCSVALYDLQNTLIHQKSLVIHGKRSLKKRLLFRDWKLSKECEPLMSLPIRYMNTYGGTIYDVSSDEKSVLLARYEANPIGKGLTHPASTIKEVEVPEIEDIAKSKESRLYAGFGAINATWEDRYKFSGTYDDQWLDQKYPLLPDDFNPEYYQMAHPDMIIRTPLNAGIRIDFENIHPQLHHISVTLPSMNFIGRITSNTDEKEFPLKVDTIVVDANSTTIDEWRIFISWRNRLKIDEQLTDENMLYLIK